MKLIMVVNKRIILLLMMIREVNSYLNIYYVWGVKLNIFIIIIIFYFLKF